MDTLLVRHGPPPPPRLPGESPVEEGPYPLHTHADLQRFQEPAVELAQAWVQLGESLENRAS